MSRPQITATELLQRMLFENGLLVHDLYRVQSWKLHYKRLQVVAPVQAIDVIARRMIPSRQTQFVDPLNVARLRVCRTFDVWTQRFASQSSRVG